MSFPSSSATLVPQALRQLEERFPDITIKFTEGEPPESIAALRAGTCDLALAFKYGDVNVGDSSEDLDGLVVHTLLQEEVQLALPASHRLADRDSIDMTELKDERWIAGCPRCRGHLIALADLAGFNPDVAFETEDYVAVLGFVSAGLGIALVPDLIVDAAPADSVKFVQLKRRSRRAIQAVTTPDLCRVPAVAATIECLEASALRLAGGDSVIAPAENLPKG